GFDSLGAQSFFHALFMPQLDVRMVHMFDGVGCLAVALLVGAEVAVVWRVPTLAALLTVVAVVPINPQSVNISPLYSGAVAAMALMLAGAANLAVTASPDSRDKYHGEVMIGLLAALLI